MKTENDNQDDKNIIPSNLFLVYKKVESTYIFEKISFLYILKSSLSRYRSYLTST